MNSLSVSIIGPYKSGKTTLVNKLQQRKGAEEDVSFFSFKYGGKNITLIDTPGDMDAPILIASVLSISDAVVFCISPDVGINFQVGELVILADTVGIKQGLICLTKTDISTSADVEKLTKNLSSLLKGTSLENFEVMPVDINNDQIIADIRAKLSMLNYNSSRIDKPFKLLVDHAFESKGMSIAVGTLANGKVGIHTDAVLAPAPFTKDISINSLQINQEEVSSAEAGDRVGVAIKGVWPWDLPRGVEVRKPKSFVDMKSGKLKVVVNKLYKQGVRDGMKLSLICNWQNPTITISDISTEGDTVTASFEADKNFCFDKEDKITLINKDLPIRVLRVVGKAEIL
ncbi:MAG: GTP-binding protein [Candidatus Parvarchaeota archaeon]|nr:GTP-binding protein [Candidatus Parvarchaeota archaeon]